LNFQLPIPHGKRWKKISDQPTSKPEQNRQTIVTLSIPLKSPISSVSVAVLNYVKKIFS
jgi:hypothetical protein